MATINLNISDDVRQAINTARAAQEKSVVLTPEDLRHREAAARRILALRPKAPQVSATQVETARRDGRP